jgi:hypothetical protein
MVHKRKNIKKQKRKIRGIILHGSFHDKKVGEIISKMTHVDVMAYLDEPVEANLIPDLEKGEVLIDSRDRGTLQRLDNIICVDGAVTNCRGDSG